VDLPHELPCVAVPRGFRAEGFDVTIHGHCAECAKKK
jgi:Fe2+ or Zn2+ uptake regulation protein